MKLVACLFYLALSAGCCGQFEFIRGAQPLFIKPQRAVTPRLSELDLAPLSEIIRQKIIAGAKALKLELKKWDVTADTYNEGVRRRNERLRRQLTE